MPQKSVTPKMTAEPTKALVREETSLRSPAMSSTPLVAQAWADGLLGSRVMPRTCQPGSLRKTSATEEP